MLDVNAFHKECDCVTAYVFDTDGNIVTTCTETSEVLADEDYSMYIELPEGTYNVVAYGGMACDKSSFTLKNIVKSVPDDIDGFQVELNHDNLTSDKLLHNHFYGMEGLEIKNMIVKDTVQMVKNTNNIRIILQQAQGDPLSSSDFEFAITDDNILMDSRNNVLPNGTIVYSPWTMGEEVIGTPEDGDTPVSVAFAEFSTARNMLGSNSRLIVTKKDGGDIIISIPLDKYLVLLKSELYSRMTAQEYLDREDRWSMVFFLDSGLRWINTHIVINDWTVRLNHIGL